RTNPAGSSWPMAADGSGFFVRRCCSSRASPDETAPQYSTRPSRPLQAAAMGRARATKYPLRTRWLR
ncbi:hypothetical protein PMAYCL1PPCAC_06090, partial [Pristionchus mayeri]